MLTNREAPEGTHILEGGLEKLMEIWNKISNINGVLDDYSKGKAENFLALYLNPSTWWLERDDGNGILYLTLIQPRLSAHAHVVYWDKRLRGTEGFTKNCLLFAVNRFDLKKVNVTLPDFAHASIAFNERIGFKREGYLRNWSYCNGKLYGVYWYGMTREEVINGAGSIPESNDAERSPAVPGDGEPATAVHGEGSSESVRAASAVGDAGVDITEHASDPGLPREDPADGQP